MSRSAFAILLKDASMGKPPPADGRTLTVKDLRSPFFWLQDVSLPFKSAR